MGATLWTKYSVKQRNQPERGEKNRQWKTNCDFFVNGTSEIGGAERHRHYLMSGRSAGIIVFCLSFSSSSCWIKQKCSQLWHEKCRSGTATKLKATVTFQGMCAIVGKFTIDCLINSLGFYWSIDRLIYWMQEFPISLPKISHWANLKESET